MKTMSRNNSIHHRQEIKAQLHRLVAQLGDEVDQVTASKSRSDFEISVPGVTGLAEAFDDYEEQTEAACRVEFMRSRSGERTTHAPGR